jgi:hypothetical protein
VETPVGNVEQVRVRKHFGDMSGQNHAIIGLYLKTEKYRTSCYAHSSLFTIFT